MLLPMIMLIKTPLNFNFRYLVRKLMNLVTMMMTDMGPMGIANLGSRVKIVTLAGKYFLEYF